MQVRQGFPVSQVAQFVEQTTQTPDILVRLAMQVKQGSRPPHVAQLAAQTRQVDPDM
jgi:hypothetical protein